MIIKCKYTSIWDNDIAITTNATLDTETFQMEIEETDEDISELEMLTGEEIEINGKTISIELNYDEVSEEYQEEILKAVA